MARIIIEPDPRFRRRAWLLIIVLGLIAVWVTFRFDAFTRLSLQSADPIERQRGLWLVQGFFWSLPVLALLLAGWLLWQARRVFQASQFPLPGQRVLQATPLYTGRQARRRAWLLLTMGIMVLLTAPALFYLGWKWSCLLASLFGGT